MIPEETRKALASTLAVDCLDYSLRMLWLSRFDKLSYGQKEHLVWLTRKFVPGAENYKPQAGIVAFEGLDHYSLARVAVDSYKKALT